MIQPRLTSLRCQTQFPELLIPLTKKSTASSASMCDYSDTDVQSACSDFDEHTADRYTYVYKFMFDGK